MFIEIELSSNNSISSKTFVPICFKKYCHNTIYVPWLKLTTVEIVIIVLRKRKEDENELNMKVI